jgi:DNA-binding protein Fis
MATLAFPPRPGRPWLVGLLCSLLTIALLLPVVLLLHTSWFVLLLALPVLPVIGILWGRYAEQRSLLQRLEEALDMALKRLRRADDTETAYFALKDALEGYRGVAGAALFVKDSKPSRGIFSPGIASGALLGLRTLPKVTDFEHLAFLAHGEEVICRSELKELSARGSTASTLKPLLAVLEDAGLDLVWFLYSEEGPVAAIVMRESVGVRLRSLRGCFAERSASFGRALWAVLPQAFDRLDPAQPESARPTVVPQPPRVISATTSKKEEPAPNKSTPETKEVQRPQSAPSSELEQRLPFSLLPDPVGFVEAFAPLMAAFEQAQELLLRHKMVRLVGPRGSSKSALAFVLALEQRGAIDWHAAPPEQDPEDPEAAVLVWDEERAGPFKEGPRRALCIVLSLQGNGLMIPLLAELGPVEVAAVLAEQLAAKKIDFTQEAKTWLQNTSFEADVEEVLLVVAGALLVQGEDTTLEATSLGAQKEVPVSVPNDETLLTSEELRDLALAEAVANSEGQEFHEAVLVFKRTLIRKALESSKNNRSKAAKLLGLQRTYLYKLIRQLGLEEEEQKAFDEPLSPR